TQDRGFWHSFNSQAGQHSDFAPTMWAVIGLAGSLQAIGADETAEESFFVPIAEAAAIVLGWEFAWAWKSRNEWTRQRRLRQRGFAVRAKGEILGGNAIDYRA